MDRSVRSFAPLQDDEDLYRPNSIRDSGANQFGDEAEGEALMRRHVLRDLVGIGRNLVQMRMSSGRTAPRKRVRNSGTQCFESSKVIARPELQQVATSRFVAVLSRSLSRGHETLRRARSGRDRLR